MKRMIDYLRDAVNNYLETNFDPTARYMDSTYIGSYLQGKAVTWPEVLIEEECDYEPLDCENCSIFDVKEDRVTISCGGDWQKAYTFELVCKSGKLHCKNVRQDFINEDLPKEILALVKEKD